MTKAEIIEYLYENNVKGDITIEQMAEDLSDHKVEIQTCFTCDYEWRNSTEEPCIYCHRGSEYKPKE